MLYRFPQRLPHQPVRSCCRQQAHGVNFPNAHRQRQKLHGDVDELGLQNLAGVAVGLEALKGLVGGHEADDGVLEGHEDHHDAEDLERVAGHVHHDGGHGEALYGGEGDLPRLLELEGVALFGGGWFSGLGGLGDVFAFLDRGC